MIDLARQYVGEIARVSAHLGTYIERPGNEGRALEAANDAALLSVAFANGAQGVIHLSAVAHLADRAMQQQIALYGEKGTGDRSLP